MKKFFIIALIAMLALFIGGICAMSDACAETYTIEAYTTDCIEIVSITPANDCFAVAFNMDGDLYTFYWDENEVSMDCHWWVTFFTFNTTDRTAWEVIDAWQE